MAEVSDVKLPEVMAVDEIDRLAVTVPLISGREPMVTEDIEIGTGLPLVTPWMDSTSIEGLPAVPTSA